MQTSLAPCVHFRSKFLGSELIPAFFKHISCLQALRYLISLYLNGKFLEISMEMEKEKNGITSILTFYMTTWSIICI